ncbi:MAG: uroporphyrinogen-III C-methyltransferase [Pseudomonadota bacterium]
MTEKTDSKTTKKTSSSKKKSQGKKTVAKKAADQKPAAAPAAASNDNINVPAQAATAGGESSGKGLSVAALVLSLVAVAAGGYAWYQTAVNARLQSGEQINRVDAMEKLFGTMQTTQDDFGKQLGLVKESIGGVESSFSEQIRQIKGDITAQESALKQQVSDATKSLGEQSSQFKTEFQGLANSIVDLRSELDRSVDSWSLEEVEQLMVIANQRLQLSGNAELASNALKLADSRLEQLANPAHSEIRSGLANDMAALAQVPKIDVAGTINALGAMVSQVATLPLAGDPNAESTGENTQSNGDADQNEGQSEGLAAAGKSFLADLAGLVQIENSESVQTPVLSTETRELTRQKTRLMLESAQLAFLREQPEVYAGRIAAIRDWTTVNFDTSADNTAAFLTQLDAVANVAPKAELPDISGSLALLRDIMKAGG